MSTTTVWSKPNCPFCTKAKRLLESKGVEFEEKIIGEGFTADDLKAVVPTARTVPQIFLAGELIGGYTELKKHYDDLGDAATRAE